MARATPEAGSAPGIVAPSILVPFMRTLVLLAAATLLGVVSMAADDHGDKVRCLWTFTPAVRNGKRVPTIVRMPIAFWITDPASAPSPPR